jgi:F-type H+-transporting ATPase subunit b
VEKIIPLGVELYVNLVAFGVLFLLLWKFAFPPITGMLDKRAETIRESLEKAEETRVEAERLFEDYKLQMAEARQEAAKVIEQGRSVAEAMKDDIVKKANEEAAGVIAKAKDTIDAEKKAAMAELQASVAELSVAVAGKLIGEKLSEADHAKLIERYIAEVGGLNAN